MEMTKKAQEVLSEYRVIGAVQVALLEILDRLNGGGLGSHREEFVHSLIETLTKETGGDAPLVITDDMLTDEAFDWDAEAGDFVVLNLSTTVGVGAWVGVNEGELTPEQAAEFDRLSKKLIDAAMPKRAE